MALTASKPSTPPLMIVFFGLGAVGSSMLINAAIPQFNCPIINLGIRLGAHTIDLASDMYNPDTASSFTFAQYAHDAALRERGVAALINMGVSSGITNFLIGDQICRITSEHRVRAEPGGIAGVVTGEDLARLLPRPRIDAVFRDLVAWDIDLFASTRDATGV